MSTASCIGIAALEIAKREVGVKETSPNWGARVKQYLAAAGVYSPAPWCISFLCWCFERAGHPITAPGRASVGMFETWAARQGYLVKRPFKGDIVCYRWDGDDWPDHAGIVERVLALRWRGGAFIGLVQTIEGNSSDAVRRRVRWIQRAKFVRIPD